MSPFPDRAAPPANQVPQAHFRVASARYFAAAGVPIVAGRAFDAHDDAAGRPVALVSRTFAERRWPGEGAVGKSVQIGTAGSAPMVIVGVVSDVKQFTLDAPPTADLYVPLHQMAASQSPGLSARLTGWCAPPVIPVVWKPL